MKSKMPTSMITKATYLKTFMFLYSSSDFGFIDYSIQENINEFISVDIPISNYIIIQPVFLKDFMNGDWISSMVDKDNWTQDKTDHMEAESIFGTYKEPFEDNWLDKNLENEKNAGLSVEMLKKLTNNKELFFLALDTKKIDVYSQTQFLKSFPFSIPKFKPKYKTSKEYQEDFSDLKRNSKSKKSFYQTQYEQKVNRTNIKIEKEESYFKCIFKSEGVHSTYHESLPQYFFILVIAHFDLLVLICPHVSLLRGSWRITLDTFLPLALNFLTCFLP